jgi:hypothetical protein
MRLLGILQDPQAWRTTVEVKYSSLWWQDEGLQETVSGYGKKLTSPYKVHFLGRWRRVYYTCFSNTATHYVIVKGEKYRFTMLNP